METYKQVRAIKRGLDVLMALNQARSATVVMLSDRTGIHRTTVYRVLETLETLGFVRRSSCDDSFHLTALVRALSQGFDESERIASVASPHLAELLSEVVWPSSVATPAEDAMVIRETTHGRSELFVHHVTVGTRSPILTTAMGRAYLACCDEQKRSAVLEKLAQTNSIDATYARDARYVKRIIETTRENGYGLSFGETDPRFGSVALPIKSNDRVMGGINVVFFTSAITKQTAVKKFVPALQRAAVAIESNLAQH